jgi:D-arabinose 1-dehydrogenase-like Zn-dependent alcohol dehydrogenase
VPDWGKAVLAKTDGRGADLVVEVGGSATFSQSLRATRTNGVIALVGNVTGSVAEVNLPLVFMFRKRLIGIVTGSVADFQAMMTHVAETGMRPALDQPIHDFDALSEALQSLPRGEHFGKIVVRVG